MTFQNLLHYHLPKYESLLEESETPTEKLGKFISSTKEAAKEMSDQNFK